MQKQNYRDALLNVINEQDKYYRLPEPAFFAELETFKTQVNQVLTYYGLGIHFNHCINDPNNPRDDGGYVILHNREKQCICHLASWSYEHPFHTFPIRFQFADETYPCHSQEDIETTLLALIRSDIFKNILNLSH